MNAIEYSLIVAVSGAAILIWAMNVCGGWAERFYERYQHVSRYWSWLRLVGVSPTRHNCVRSVKALSLVAILAVAFGVVMATLDFLR